MGKTPAVWVTLPHYQTVLHNLLDCFHSWITMRTFTCERIHFDPLLCSKKQPRVLSHWRLVVQCTNIVVTTSYHCRFTNVMEKIAQVIFLTLALLVKNSPLHHCKSYGKFICMLHSTQSMHSCSIQQQFHSTWSYVKALV